METCQPILLYYLLLPCKWTIPKIVLRVKQNICRQIRKRRTLATGSVNQFDLRFSTEWQSVSTRQSLAETDLDRHTEQQKLAALLPFCPRKQIAAI